MKKFNRREVLMTTTSAAVMTALTPMIPMQALASPPSPIDPDTELLKVYLEYQELLIAMDYAPDDDHQELTDRWGDKYREFYEMTPRTEKGALAKLILGIETPLIEKELDLGEEAWSSLLQILIKTTGLELLPSYAKHLHI